MSFCIIVFQLLVPSSSSQVHISTMISHFYVFHFCFVGSDGTGADTTPRSLSLPGGELEDDVVDDDDGDDKTRKYLRR